VEYGIHILVVAPQEYVSIYSTRRVAPLQNEGSTGIPKGARFILAAVVLRTTARNGYSCISMQRYWSSLLRYCPRDCFCWLPNFVDIQLVHQFTGILKIPLPALLSNIPPKAPTSISDTARGHGTVGGELHSTMGNTWPLHDIVVTNIVWCIAYTREVGRGVVYCGIDVQ